jgi:hypothetical protein
VRSIALAAVVLPLLACGTPSPDLFVVERSGSVPGADLRLLVSDGTVRCNGGEPRQITSEQLLEARGIARDLPAVGTPPRAEARLFSFRVRFEDGTLRFADTAAAPPVLPRVARLTRRLAQDVCGLER